MSDIKIIKFAETSSTPSAEKSFRQICVVYSEVSFSATTGNRTILTLYR